MFQITYVLLQITYVFCIVYCSIGFLRELMYVIAPGKSSQVWVLRCFEHQMASVQAKFATASSIWQRPQWLPSSQLDSTQWRISTAELLALRLSLGIYFILARQGQGQTGSCCWCRRLFMSIDMADGGCC